MMKPFWERTIIWVSIPVLALLVALYPHETTYTPEISYKTTEQILKSPKKKEVTLQTLFPPPQVLKKTSTADFPIHTPTPTPQGKNSKILASLSPSAAVPTKHETGNSTNILTEEQITYLGNCESGMDPAKNTGNGYYGAFQFSASTWSSMGTGYARADLAPLEVQKDAVQRLVARSSIFSQFPGCSSKMRSLGII